MEIEIPLLFDAVLGIALKELIQEFESADWK